MAQGGMVTLEVVPKEFLGHLSTGVSGTFRGCWMASSELRPSGMAEEELRNILVRNISISSHAKPYIWVEGEPFPG